MFSLIYVEFKSFNQIQRMNNDKVLCLPVLPSQNQCSNLILNEWIQTGYLVSCFMYVLCVHMYMCVYVSGMYICMPIYMWCVYMFVVCAYTHVCAFSKEND